MRDSLTNVHPGYWNIKEKCITLTTLARSAAIRGQGIVVVLFYQINCTPICSDWWPAVVRLSVTERERLHTVALPNAILSKRNTLLWIVTILYCHKLLIIVNTFILILHFFSCVIRVTMEINYKVHSNSLWSYCEVFGFFLSFYMFVFYPRVNNRDYW